MINLNDVYYFVHVVEKKGFSAASKALNISKSKLSRRVLELEARLGVLLIQRDSRRFFVTDVGMEVYQHGRAMMEDADAAEQSVKRRVNEPQGTIRLTCSTAIAQFVLADILPRFAEQFPKVSIIQHVTNRCVDLVDEGFDLAVRAHAQPLPNSSLIQRPVGVTACSLFASRSYLDKNGIPSEPNDLSEHPGLLLQDGTNESKWRLRRSSEEVVLPFRPKVCSDDIMTLKVAAEAGMGIAALPTYACRAEVSQGRLVPILTEWSAGQAMITVLAPSRRGLLPSVRALTRFLAAEFHAQDIGRVVFDLCAE